MSIRDLYATLLERVKGYDLKEYSSVIADCEESTPCNVELEGRVLKLLDLERKHLVKMSRASKMANQSSQIPPGAWHMLTVTTPAGSHESVIKSHHADIMQYCNEHDIRVYLAALEKSSIWHIHYAICAPNGLGNAKRDLNRLIPHRLEFGKKCKTLKSFNGLCNYVTKRLYPNDTTAVKMIIEDILYVPGKGYQIQVEKTEDSNP